MARLSKWFVPLLAVLLLVLLGWWTRDNVERSIKQKLTGELKTLLAVDTEALKVWLDSQRANVHVLAEDAEIRQSIFELIAISWRDDATPQTLLAARPQQKLRELLKMACDEYNYSGYAILEPEGQIVAAARDELVGQKIPASLQDYLTEVLRGKVVVTHPFQTPNRSSDSSDRSGLDEIVMLAATPIRDDNGRTVAMLGMRIRPMDNFSRILLMARMGESGETYAFDAAGRMLSDSRFDAQLRDLGMISDSHSVLQVYIRDPGGDMTTGFRPLTSREERPLTYAVTSALASRDSAKDAIGANVDGYRDYRGVPVIGAWRWLPEYNFGVVTEIDVSEAYRPLFRLRAIFGGLFGLVVIGTVAVLIYGRVVAALRRRMKRAQKQIEQLGQYSLVEKIGEGGMGQVYRAAHAMLRRPTAIKLLRLEYSTPQAVARFEREVQLTSQLTHPNTISIYDYGRTPDNIFYYAMEFLEGAHLGEIVAAHGPMSPGRVIHILRQVCASLAEAHETGLIHRDIKPANIILCRRGGVEDVVKVLDFGLVKEVQPTDVEITSANVVTGTPQYISPEGVDAPASVDARSDLYSLGAVGYYLLTGQHVFAGGSAMRICFDHLNTPPIVPSQRLGRPLPADLEALILKCLEKRPEARPPGAFDLAAELGRCVDAGTWTDDDARKWWARHRASLRPIGGSPSSASSVANELTVGVSLVERVPS